MNADALIFCNLYLYCQNNPIRGIDNNGHDYCDLVSPKSSVLVLYDGRENATAEHPNLKGLKSQGSWAVSTLRENGYETTYMTFTTIPEFIEAWNSIKPGQYDVILIYAHGSAGSIDCDHAFIRNEEGTLPYMEGENMCYPAGCLNTIDTKKIGLFSCNGATPNGNNKTAAGMLSRKANGAPVTAAYNASVNYEPGTGNPCLGPGLSGRNPFFENVRRIIRFLSCDWIEISEK